MTFTISNVLLRWRWSVVTAIALLVLGFEAGKHFTNGSIRFSGSFLVKYWFLA